MQQTPTDTPTPQRKELDPVFKEAITLSFQPYVPDIPTQVEVSRLPRTIDVLVILSDPRVISRVRLETLFDYLREQNQLEFKGKGDALTLFDFDRIRGRSYLYMGENEVLTADMTVTIISARTPRNVLYAYPEDVQWEKIAPGHYRSTTDPIEIHLLVCNELEIEPKNYPLLLFASSEEKFRQFVERIVAEDNDVMIYYALRSNPETTSEVLTMAGKLTAYEKHIKSLADHLGGDILKYITPEEMAAVMTPQQRLEGLTPEQRLEGLTPEAKEKLRRLLNGSNGR
jgi:hypothetical protein